MAGDNVGLSQSKITPTGQGSRKLGDLLSRGVPLVAFGLPSGSDYTMVLESALDSGEAIIIPRGTFIVEQGIIPSGRSIFGASRTQSILKLADGANATVLTNEDQTTGSDITLSNFTIDGNKANQNAYTGPASECLGLSIIGALNVDASHIVTKNTQGRGMFFSGNARKDGPAWFNDLYSLNAGYIGIHIGSGFRRTSATSLIADNAKSAGVMLDVSQMIANGIHAWNCCEDDAEFNGGIFIRNVTGCILNGLLSGSSFRHGIVVAGMRHSAGAGWVAYQSGHKTDNTYDDIHFTANPDVSGYGENAFLNIIGMRPGRNIQLVTGYNDTLNYNRYGLYVGDESNTEIRLDVQPVTNNKTGKIRFPTNRGTLSINGSPIVSSQTAAYGVKTDESGRIFNNTGAAARVDYTLPAPAPGLEYTFNVTDTVGIRVIAAGSGRIRFPDGTQSAVGGRADATSIGSMLEIFAADTTYWQVKGAVNGWTLT